MKIKRKTRTARMRKLCRAKRERINGTTPGAPSGVKPRALARSVAKANMRRKGVEKINRKLSHRGWLRWVLR